MGTLQTSAPQRDFEVKTHTFLEQARTRQELYQEQYHLLRSRLIRLQTQLRQAQRHSRTAPERVERLRTSIAENQNSLHILLSWMEDALENYHIFLEQERENSKRYQQERQNLKRLMRQCATQQRRLQRGGTLDKYEFRELQKLIRLMPALQQRLNTLGSSEIQSMQSQLDLLTLKKYTDEIREQLFPTTTIFTTLKTLWNWAQRSTSLTLGSMCILVGLFLLINLWTPHFHPGAQFHHLWHYYLSAPAAFTGGIFGVCNLLLSTCILTLTGPTRDMRRELHYLRTRFGSIAGSLYWFLLHSLLGMPILALVAIGLDLFVGYLFAEVMVHHLYMPRFANSNAIVLGVVLNWFQAPFGGTLYTVRQALLFGFIPQIDKEINRLELLLQSRRRAARSPRIPDGFYLKGVNFLLILCIAEFLLVGLLLNGFGFASGPNPSQWEMGVISVLSGINGIATGYLFTWIATLVIWFTQVGWPQSKDDWLSFQQTTLPTMLLSTFGAMAPFLAIVALSLFASPQLNQAALTPQKIALNVCLSQLFGALLSQLVTAWQARRIRA
ncbi:hypothetical protein EI42_04584 [Thermosporothrix hazakensis]|jgi:hypothetical protein|uniref:Uncharacterized protein n=2 Tax=Thermosporothrix TaxID=768650 RepID=A0A326U1E0_THEHA|nr:hypothetical protein [Thermosporothrix hazakensis]PZW24702.1 hypothetical protein EI42_04584 [Thermosporothrix hazakensis]BBH90316.1 hypothetical protein KTC_50670 [Thermosporothrix sp. COM3]GCE48352.1 hypothetical protein KTH_32210 [Thermosporothrix hazakensis]